MLKTFAELLGCLEGFFKHISHKSRLERDKFNINTPQEVERREQAKEAFIKDILMIYDDFISTGTEPRQAISATNRAMKTKGSPWASYDIVYDTIRRAGRFNNSGRPRTGSKKGPKNG